MYVVTSLDKVLYDNYLCLIGLMVLNKQQLIDWEEIIESTAKLGK